MIDGTNGLDEVIDLHTLLSHTNDHPTECTKSWKKNRRHLIVEHVAFLHFVRCFPRFKSFPVDDLSLAIYHQNRLF